MKKQFYKLYEVTHALLLTLLLSIVGVRAFCSASFVTNVSSTLTGESGIVAFTCPEVGTLYNAWVDAGRPGKIKFLERLTETIYVESHIMNIIFRTWICRMLT